MDNNFIIAFKNSEHGHLCDEIVEKLVLENFPSLAKAIKKEYELKFENIKRKIERAELLGLKKEVTINNELADWIDVVNTDLKPRHHYYLLNRLEN